MAGLRIAALAALGTVATISTVGALVAPGPAAADAGGAGAPGADSPVPDGPVRRFAVVVGNNEGGEGTRPLRYAHRDAERVFDALLRLGGVGAGDARLLLAGSAAELAEALAATDRGVSQARAAGQRAELFVYYSGHAKDGSLRLGETAFPLESLKSRLSGSGAEVRIAFLDACRSGVITRTKGARRAPAFDVDPGPRAAKGLVILTSSSNDEESQESDEIMGSFFTHALVSGMLGDADASGDGRVTLAEAYAYAYDRTVAGTLDTSAGPQHPTFSFDLAGHGDVVLTNLRSPTSFLVLPPELAGTFVILDQGRRLVAAEVQKVAGLERRVPLAGGAYVVKTRLADRLRVGEVQVPARGEARLDEASMRDVPFAEDPVKGVVAELVQPRGRVSMALLGGYQSFLSAPARELYFPSVGLFGLDVELRDYLRPGWIVGFDAAVGSTSGVVEVDGRPFDFEFSQATLGATIGRELFPGSSLRPVLGLRLGFVSMERTFPGEPRLPAQQLLTTAPGVVAGATWDALPPISLYARCRTSWLVYAADENRSLGYLDVVGGARVEF